LGCPGGKEKRNNKRVVGCPGGKEKRNNKRVD